MNRKYYIASCIIALIYIIAIYIECSSVKEVKISLCQDQEVNTTHNAQQTIIHIPTEEITLKSEDVPAKEPEWGFDFDYICRVVAAESRGEPYEGQVAVARCIWNTAINKSLTMEQVVEMPNRYADPVASELVTESVRDACRDAFLGTNLPTEESIEYFYSGNWSSWHENALDYVMTIGGHKFFKER